VAPGKERLEGLIEAPKHLLFSRDGPLRELGRGASHGLEFVGLHLVSDRDTLPAIGLDTLLQPGVIELAEVPEHIVECSRLGLVWIDAKFVAEYLRRALVPVLSERDQEPVKRDQRSTGSLFVSHPKVQHKRRGGASPVGYSPRAAETYGGEQPLLRQVSVAISNAQAFVLHQWAIT
jgi:hypothetical protein